MTTPAQGPVLSASADKASYAVGDPLTLTVTYSDSNSVAQDLTITVTGSDSAGNTASSAVTVQVITEGTPGPMDIGATDSFGDEYAVASNDGSSTAVLTTTVGSPPVINPL